MPCNKIIQQQKNTNLRVKENGEVAPHKPSQCGTQQLHSTGVGVDGWRLTS